MGILPESIQRVLLSVFSAIREHNDRWYLFDQLLFSTNWISDETLFLLKTAVFNPAFLSMKRSNYQAYPFRTRIIGKHLEGYSDHFPVYAIIGLTIE